MVAVTIACVVMIKRNRTFWAVWIYYVVALLPVIGIIQVGRQAMADRYTYLPSIGPFLLLGLLAVWVFAQAKTMRRLGLFVTVVSAAIAVSVIAAMAILTNKQIRVWENSVSLWNTVIEADPQGVPIAYLNRGGGYYEMGQLDRAMDDFNIAIALEPLHPAGYYNKGQVLAALGRFEEAIASFSSAITLDQQGARGYIGRQFYFFDRGRAFMITGQIDSAISDFRTACEMGHNDACANLQYFQTTGADKQR